MPHTVTHAAIPTAIGLGAVGLGFSENTEVAKNLTIVVIAAVAPDTCHFLYSLGARVRGKIAHLDPQKWDDELFDELDTHSWYSVPHKFLHSI